MWKKVGLNAKIEVMEQAAMGKIDEAGQQHITNWSATSALGDPDGYLWRNWGPDNNFQKRGYWKPEEFNKLGAGGAQHPGSGQALQELPADDGHLRGGRAGHGAVHPAGVVRVARRAMDWTPYPIYYFDPRAYNLKITS